MVADDSEGVRGVIRMDECWCCSTEHERRSPADDPWEGRLDGYCYDCAINRCDAYPGTCPVKGNDGLEVIYD